MQRGGAGLPRDDSRICDQVMGPVQRQSPATDSLSLDKFAYAFSFCSSMAMNKKTGTIRHGYLLEKGRRVVRLWRV